MPVGRCGLDGLEEYVTAVWEQEKVVVVGIFVGGVQVVNSSCYTIVVGVACLLLRPVSASEFVLRSLMTGGRTSEEVIARSVGVVYILRYVGGE